MRLSRVYPADVSSETCPYCKGVNVTKVGIGKYRCNTLIEYDDRILVDDPMSRIAYGTPGQKWQDFRNRRECGRHFTVAVARSTTLCSGAPEGYSCGLYSVGICQGSNCGVSVCEEHGRFGSRQQDGVLCSRCRSEGAAVERAERKSRRRAADSVATEAAAERAAAACEKLGSAKEPSAILSVLQQHMDELNRRMPPWTVAEHRESFATLIVPAWQRYLEGRQPKYWHELCRFVSHTATSRISQSTESQPCWLIRDLAMGDIKGERGYVSATSAYTADTVYLLADTQKYSWSQWGRAPKLNGMHVVCPGRFPEARRRGGFKELLHCFPTLESRPLISSDVLRLVVSGHTSITVHDDVRSMKAQFR
jgi:hypothetical protein